MIINIVFGVPFSMRLFLLLCLVLILFSPSVFADEAMFGYLYTTDTLPQGHWEYEQVNTLREGKAQGNYLAFDLRNEIEFGITNEFTGSVYINSSYIFTDNVYNPDMVSMNLPNQNGFDVNGMSMEFKYRILSPYLDPFGFMVYMEPEISVRDPMTGLDTIERAVELRLIFQKNFLDDLLITSANIMAEPEWELDDGNFSKELWMEFTAGATYRFRPNWWLGLEMRNHREFTDMNFGNQEHSAFFLGPNVHYGIQKWWATLTILPQIFGEPTILGVGYNGVVIQDPTLHLGQHERLEVRLKFGVNI
jgi:hypothetical protein